MLMVSFRCAVALEIGLAAKHTCFKNVMYDSILLQWRKDLDVHGKVSIELSLNIESTIKQHINAINAISSFDQVHITELDA